MRLNENIKIIGKKVILVPYKRKHVKKYHKWMQSTELQDLTSSMPLTLDEEYAMQLSWLQDEDKCTFLVLDRHIYDETHDEIAALVGDTNLFLCQMEEEFSQVKCYEAEIMIAEESARRKGLGVEAILLMLKYGQEFLGIEKYVVKIGMNNEPSLRMFRKIHFAELSKSEVFQEITLALAITSEWLNWLDKQVNLECQKYVE